jgi:cytochrome c551/c552
VRNPVLGIVFLAILFLPGCGGRQAGQSAPPESQSPAPAPPAGFVVPSDLDQGPRAGESPVDQALAAKGGRIFQTRGCVACHAFGRRVLGPDLKGVAMLRTARWMETQILHPVEMTQQDPVSKQLKAEYQTQMTNLGLTGEEARAVVEYLKQAGR